MNINYAIFRTEPIYTLNDLAEIGAHNKREKKDYNSNPDIDINKSKNNIELVPLTDRYVKGFYNLTEEYKQEHDERLKTERDNRKRTYREMLNASKNVVADELLFTASNNFFQDMSTDDIKKWADTCMEFVYNDLGYTKNQVLHATIHLDEKTPHIHCVVIPLIKKFDKRTNCERFTISKKQYIKNKTHLSELQDKYHKRLTSKGYDIERGIKGSDSEHLSIKDLKKISKILEQKTNISNNTLDKVVNNLHKKMPITQNIIPNKNYAKVKKDTSNSMNNIIKEIEKTIKIDSKINSVLQEIKNYENIYNLLEKDNQKYQNEIKLLKLKNKNLEQENLKLKRKIIIVIHTIKMFFRKLLQNETEHVKCLVVIEIKKYFFHNQFNSKDVYDISKETSKQNELFNYAKIPNYQEYKDNKLH